MILLTGATGYVGGRLLEVLAARGYPVRCLARRPEKLPEFAGVETVAGDCLDPRSLAAAMGGVETAYYLVHSMASQGSFEEDDRRAARYFAEAALQSGVRRIIYLGGLGDAREELSPHLRSRQEVGEVLRSTGVQVIEFRAAVVIGAGSLSFEMIRSLVERLPVMVAPRWVSVPTQPIAIRDLLNYLMAALDYAGRENRICEIGGADCTSYGGLMSEYARQRGLRRLVVPVPVLTPRLSSLWLGLVTPVYVRVGRKLIDSIRHSTVVRDRSALDEFPVRPMGYREAIREALAEDAPAARLVLDRAAEVAVPAQQAFAPIRRIGGAMGWYYWGWLWKVRGVLDQWMGGEGMRPGRSDPEHLAVGDIVDCWQVEAFEPDQRLRLAARMKLPGRAWLEFSVTGSGTSSVIRQTAIFDPKGLIGRSYWYAVYPLHRVLFAGMLRRIALAALDRPVPV